MTKKSFITLILVLAVALAAGSAWAFGPGMGAGGRGAAIPGCGYGQWAGPMMNDDARNRFEQETASLRGEMLKKMTELRALWTAEQVDEAKIRTLTREIRKIRDTLSDKTLDMSLEFKKKNPDWRPGYGYGHGRGSHGRGPWADGRGTHGHGHGQRWR